MAKAAAVAEPEKKEKKAKEPKIEYITSKHLADDLGIKPATLRRYLRSLPAFQDSGYTRYKWDPDNKTDVRQIEDIKKGYSKFATEEKEKNKKRLEEMKKDAKNGGKGKKGKAKVEEEEEEETEEDEELE